METRLKKPPHPEWGEAAMRCKQNEQESADLAILDHSPAIIMKKSNWAVLALCFTLQFFEKRITSPLYHAEPLQELFLAKE